MANGENGNGIWLKWAMAAIGMLMTLIISWLGAVTSISQGHTPLAYTAAVEQRAKDNVDHTEERLKQRLVRIEDKLDRLIERGD